MAVNRQSQKQRRAARNRANRAAIAARSENAAAAAVAGGDAAAKPPKGEKGRRGTGERPGRAERMARGSGRPGDRAVLLALLLAILMGGFMLFLRVPVDDRGEPLPANFKGVALEAREVLTGEEIPDQTVSLIEANGLPVLIFIALPIAVCGFALWAIRRPGPGRSRMLTFAMLALAGAVLLGGGLLFMPSLIALAVASFQVRRADMPARVAERVTGGKSDEVIDAESEEADSAGDEASDEADAEGADTESDVDEGQGRSDR